MCVSVPHGLFETRLPVHAAPTAAGQDCGPRARGHSQAAGS